MEDIPPRPYAESPRGCMLISCDLRLLGDPAVRGRAPLSWTLGVSILLVPPPNQLGVLAYG